jgi:hypothetical protein
MRETMTAFLRAAQQRGCRFQVGSDMLFEQIPAYLEFFGLPSTTPEVLRRVALLEPVKASGAQPNAPGEEVALAPAPSVALEETIA